MGGADGRGDGGERGANTMGRESERGEAGVLEGEGQRVEDFVKNEREKKLLRNVRADFSLL